MKRRLITIIIAAACIFGCFAVGIFAGDALPEFGGTFFSLVPPVVAIALALITKEVYSSLFVGVTIGALFYSGFSFEGTVNHLAKGGFLAVLTDESHMGIMVFLVVLGVMVSLMNKAGGSAAFGKWVGEHIKSRVGAQIATVFLGILIFIDDYFNCLTVGSVMRPVADKHKISRSKLAYIIDSTAAPVCIIAPISSWAAAVAGFVKGEDGFALFIKAIPYNFYALLTIFAMLFIIIAKADFGPMAVHERNALKGDLFTSGKEDFEEREAINTKGRVFDLVAPVVILIICCVIGMVYTGGAFSGENIIDAFANCDADYGLMVGSFCALLITIAFYSVRNVLSFNDCMRCIPDGFKAMVPAILILTLAWTLQAMTSSLGAAEYVAALVDSGKGAFMSFLPAIIFVVACFLAFATGTSWGTFSILIPIVVDVFAGSDPTMMIISISACMAGAVCGDHCSPISDTTIMASAGAQCNHVNHVSTQLPYALLVAAVSFVTYIIAGLSKSVFISLPVGIALTAGALVIMKKLEAKKVKA